MIGAFAITADPIIIALGLGLIGAMFVRSLTVYMVRRGTLDQYVYLEHGAHWAIGALAAMLLVSIGHHIPEVVTGLTGVVIIFASFVGASGSGRRTRRWRRSRAEPYVKTSPWSAFQTSTSWKWRVKSCRWMKQFARHITVLQGRTCSGCRGRSRRCRGGANRTLQARVGGRRSRPRR